MTTAAAPNSFDLGGHLAAERRRLDAVLSVVAARASADAPPELAQPLRYALEGGGKRLRPVLCLAAYRAVPGGGEPSEAMYELAASLEIVHTYSLVHDDLPCMDDDDLRRGRPTVHRAFDGARALLAGAALIPLACAVLERAAAGLGLAPAERASLVGELCRAAGGGGMVGGQLLDLEAEGRALTLEELEEVHRRKTGALLTAALRLGGLAARAPDPALAALDAAGRHLGLAFQIADDLLDVTGTDEVLGKAAGRDRALAKATFPGLLGVDGARARARAEADAAVRALATAGLATPELVALARYAVERDR